MVKGKRIAPGENVGWDKVELGISTKKEFHEGNSKGNGMTEIALDRTLSLSDSSLDCIGECRHHGNSVEAKGSPSKSRFFPARSRIHSFWLSWIAMKRLKVLSRQALESNISTSIMGIATIYALFGDDIRQLAFSAPADPYFTVIASVAFFLFVFEMCVSIMVLPGYMNFYFYLDFLATTSFFGELDWVNWGLSDEYENDNALQSARAGRISRVGARAGRFIRVFRMVRLWRLAKPLYKYTLGFVNNRTGTNVEPHVSKPGEEEGEGSLPPESYLGKNMSHLTTKRVIVGVLGMLIVIPLLTYSSTDQSSSFGISLIHNFAVARVDDVAAQPGLNNAISTFTSQFDDVVFIDINGDIVFETDNVYDEKLRANEKVTLLVRETLDSGDTFTTTAVLLIRKEREKIAVRNILLTLVIIILLITGSMICSQDVNRIVLLPIETLMQLVQNIARNPLDFKLDINNEAIFEEGFETTKLLNTVCKIAGLMKVGFGEAGANIIAQNLQESHNQKLNLLTAGKRIESIFGFCDIRRFTDTTECLQEEVMLFVNRIAYIVHNIVVQCNGTANKNIGDAFLLTWKLDGLSDDAQTELTDQALLSFLKIIVEIEKNQDYIFGFSVAGLSRLFDRMPGYKVRIGFGLHLGWAIEGALGSAKKIDATYISPHVNMAELLESNTKEYDVPLLISEPFYNKLSLEAQKFCRQVDRVQISRNEEPMGLYTYDCDVNQDFSSPEQALVKMKEPFTLIPSIEQSILRRKAHRRICKEVISSPQNGKRRQTQKNEKGDPIKVVLPKHGSSLDGNTRHISFMRLNGPEAYEQLDEKYNNPKTPSPRKERKTTFFISKVFRPSVMKAFQHPKRHSQPCNLEVAPSTDITAAELLRRASRATITGSFLQQVKPSDFVPDIVIPKYTRSIWLTDSDLKRLRVNVSDSFRSEWAYAFDLFVKGSWKEALSVFQYLQQNDPGLVVPARKILCLMEESNGVAPKGWPGWCRLYSHEIVEDK